MSLATPPLISVIVVGYKMARQLANTLFTLSPEFQQGIDASAYEVVVVENASEDMLSEAQLAALPANVRYFSRAESSHTCVPAVNYAFEQCRGSYIGLMIDGARMVSPGVLHYARMAATISDDAIAVIPGYHLGSDEQHELENDEEKERALLASIPWQEEGYQLFSIATFSGGNNNGFFHPFMECNCVFASKANFARIGYADERFTLRGGGSVNLHMYRALGLVPNTQLFMLAGEGSFHQCHGGVTTRPYAEREAEILSHKTQLRSFWQDDFHALRREPILLGKISHWAQPFLQRSSAAEANRFHRLQRGGGIIWQDDSKMTESDYSFEENFTDKPGPV